MLANKLWLYKNLTKDKDDWTNNNQYTQIKHSSTQKSIDIVGVEHWSVIWKNKSIVCKNNPNI